MPDGDREKLRAECLEERNACISKIINSKSKRKIVVAGPGTGKTTLFSLLLKQKGGKSLTLSFINALVDDLAVSLCGISEVKTLHGFALGQLKGDAGVAFL
jgi:replication-associated recombination protein RarA